MPSFLTVIAIIGVLSLTLLLILLIQSLIAPRLLAGTLTEADPQTCIGDKQWVIYDCSPNPWTGYGCIVPGSGGTAISRKRVAVQVSPCLPPTGSTTYAGERVISFVWQAGEAGPCISSGNTCCNYTSSCTQTVRYICRATSSGKGGENQCLPAFLPAPYPQFDPTVDYTKVPIDLQIACRGSNYCTTPIYSP